MSSRLHPKNIQTSSAGVYGVMDAVAGLTADFKRIYTKEIAMLCAAYPQLTQLDICILMLLGTGTSNQDILLLLQMEKRTYYKRRQILARRMGMFASELNRFAVCVTNGKSGLLSR
ncbi:MAG: hypothetical protein IJV55_01985 [Paludibacteraceae bacterium]|nr:hypothetical protein [Paludibacteraceae bacterium]MBQ9704949.1 hypothetical protein [Paludibacteraceae bacterium]